MRYLRVALATLLLGGCSEHDAPTPSEPEPPQPPAATASIIAVTTIDEQPAPDITVSLSGPVSRSKVTDSTGRAVFLDLTAGTYEVLLASGFDTSRVIFAERTKSVSLGPGDTVSVAFVGSSVPSPPQQNVVIEGLVWLDENRDGIWQATTDTALAAVAVTLSGTQDRSTSTGADGRYTFTNLPTGSYRLLITNPDSARYAFDAVDAAVTVSVPDTVTVNFRAVRR